MQEWQYGSHCIECNQSVINHDIPGATDFYAPEVPHWVVGNPNQCEQCGKPLLESPPFVSAVTILPWSLPAKPVPQGVKDWTHPTNVMGVQYRPDPSPDGTLLFTVEHGETFYKASSIEITITLGSGIADDGWVAIGPAGSEGTIVGASAIRWNVATGETEEVNFDETTGEVFVYFFSFDPLTEFSQ